MKHPSERHAESRTGPRPGRGRARPARSAGPTGPARSSRGPRVGLFALALAVFVPSGAAEDLLEDRPHGFSIPDTRAARDLADSADAHIAAGRWQDAVADLQELLEQHRGAVLGAERPEHAGRTSQQPVHRGAARHARERLLAFPEAGRQVYSQRYGDEAALALGIARARSDRSSLAEVARRYPLTRAAELAWWSLGDLELELGNVQEAVGAWKRAVAARSGTPLAELGPPQTWAALLAERADARGTPDRAGLGPGQLARLSLAQSALDAEGAISPELAARTPLLGELRLPGAGEGLGPPPGREADEWPHPVRLPPGGPFQGNHNAFHAVRSGDTLFITDSMRLMAINAYSGTVLWDSGRAPGWDALSLIDQDGFFKAIDREGTLVAPAASRHVAVAALQIPVAQEENMHFQRIEIMKKLPDRRLFAFDAKTGEPLWDHRPPPLWDGDSGSFSQRMRVVGPPVIAGSRVLVPAVRMRGRIDYHVGCFRLDTGELLWSANLISGQRETNMFGRATKEFAAAPLRVEGDQVIALTQLGTLAALDLYTGEIRWQTLYDQIPLPKNKHYDATLRRKYWRNAPPTVAAGMVIATPFDSEDLIGVDLATGALVWSKRWDTIRALAGRDADIDLLLGADENTVYLAGDRVIALEAPSGLDRGVPTLVRWVFEDEALDQQGSWPVLGRDRVVIPTQSVRIDVDRLHGKRLGSASWDGEGNLLLDEGALFRLTSRSLTGYFAWDALLSRSRRELVERPDDPAAALALGRLLASRGVSEWSDPGDTNQARIYLTEAHELLESFLRRDRSGDHAAAIAAELHTVLRHEARVRADLADTPGAQRALQRARALAPSRDDLRNTLLEELALLRGRETSDADGPWARTLATLGEECADMLLRCEVRLDDVGAASLGARFVPLIALGDARTEGDSLLVGLPVGLWVRMERARVAELDQDTATVFRELHAIIDRYGAVELPHGTAAELAAEKLGALLAAGRTGGYELFEREARNALERALEAHDRDTLALVSRRFPHSLAAREANDTLLDWAREDSDARTVASIVLDELPETWQISSATEREVGLALRLASALGRAGNRELRAGLLRRLAAHHPELRSPLAEDRDAPLSELVERLEPASLAALPPPTFDDTARSVATYVGEHELLGELPTRTLGTLLLTVHVDRAAGVGELFAIAPEAPDAPVWRHALQVSRLPRRWTGRVAAASGRCLLAIEDAVLALDGETGEQVWSFGLETDEPEFLVASDGVALVVVRRPDETSVVHALDAQNGLSIWSVDASDPTLQDQPLVAEGRVVFLPNINHKRLVVRDLYTGKLAYEYELPSYVKDPKRTFYEGCWIEDGKLILPWFLAARYPERNHILAVDLERGDLAWRIAIPDPDGIPRDLHSILQHGGKTYLVLWTAPAAGRSVTFGEIRELRTNLPAISNPIGDLRLNPGDRLLGVERRERVTLPTPHAFVRSPSRDAKSTYLRMIHLPYGERWAHVLPVPTEELYNGLMPLPALSDSTVAFAYTEWRDRRRNRARPTTKQTSLVFVDRESGLARDARILPDDLGGQDRIEFLPFGPSLVMRGRSQLEILQ